MVMYGQHGQRDIYSNRRLMNLKIVKRSNKSNHDMSGWRIKLISSFGINYIFLFFTFQTFNFRSSRLKRVGYIKLGKCMGNVIVSWTTQKKSLNSKNGVAYALMFCNGLM